MNNIKKLRETAGMTQRELAARVHVAQAAVARWERGLADPTWDKAPALAQVLGCPIDDLFADGPSNPFSRNPAPASKG